MLLTQIDSWQHLPCLLSHDCNTVCVCMCIFYLNHVGVSPVHHGPFSLSTSAFPKSRGVLLHNLTSTYFVKLPWLTVCCLCFSLWLVLYAVTQSSFQVMVSDCIQLLCLFILLFSQKRFNSSLTDFYDMNIFEDYRAGGYREWKMN